MANRKDLETMLIEIMGQEMKPQNDAQHDAISTSRMAIFGAGFAGAVALLGTAFGIYKLGESAGSPQTESITSTSTTNPPTNTQHLPSPTSTPTPPKNTPYLPTPTTYVPPTSAPYTPPTPIPPTNTPYIPPTPIPPTKTPYTPPTPIPPTNTPYIPPTPISHTQLIHLGLNVYQGYQLPLPTTPAASDEMYVADGDVLGDGLCHIMTWGTGKTVSGISHATWNLTLLKGGTASEREMWVGIIQDGAAKYSGEKGTGYTCPRAN